MDWSSPFIIYRLSRDGKLEEVYHAPDLKNAKYWLSYIAEPGDLLCKTPAHPRHSGSGKYPEYWSHKDLTGATSREQEKWNNFAQKMDFDFKYPEEQMRDPSA